MMLARQIATVGGIGLIKPAPGTWGSAAALPLAWLIVHYFGLTGLMLASAAVFAVGTWAASAFERAHGAHDASEVVIDEVVGQWIALMPIVWFGAPWAGWGVAFALFRAFDIVKPGPIGLLDRRVSGGMGTMLDDVAAGVCAALVVCVPFWLEIV